MQRPPSKRLLSRAAATSVPSLPIASSSTLSIIIHACDTRAIPITKITRRAVGSEVALKPGALVPHAGRDGGGARVARPLLGTDEIEGLPSALELVAAAGVPEAPVAERDAHVAVVVVLVVERAYFTAFAFAPVFTPAQDVSENIPGYIVMDCGVHIILENSNILGGNVLTNP